MIAEVEIIARGAFGFAVGEGRSPNARNTPAVFLS